MKRRRVHNPRSIPPSKRRKIAPPLRMSLPPPVPELQGGDIDIELFVSDSIDGPWEPVELLEVNPMNLPTPDDHDIFVAEVPLQRGVPRYLKIEMTNFAVDMAMVDLNVNGQPAHSSYGPKAHFLSRGERHSVHGFHAVDQHQVTLSRFVLQTLHVVSHEEEEEEEEDVVQDVRDLPSGVIEILCQEGINPRPGEISRPVVDPVQLDELGLAVTEKVGKNRNVQLGSGVQEVVAVLPRSLKGMIWHRGRVMKKCRMELYQADSIASIQARIRYGLPHAVPDPDPDPVLPLFTDAGERIIILSSDEEDETETTSQDLARAQQQRRRQSFGSNLASLRSLFGPSRGWSPRQCGKYFAAVDSRLGRIGVEDVFVHNRVKGSKLPDLSLRKLRSFGLADRALRTLIMEAIDTLIEIEED